MALLIHNPPFTVAWPCAMYRALLLLLPSTTNYAMLCSALLCALHLAMHAMHASSSQSTTIKTQQELFEWPRIYIAAATGHQERRADEMQME
jgi:hypothetical protein